MFRAEDPQGQDLTDDKLLTRHTIEEVLPALKRWRDAERSATAVHGIRERVSAELKHRSVYKQLPEASATKHAQAWDADEICDMVKALVDSENQLLYRKSLYPAAEAQIEAEPELIVHRVILHIRCVEKGRCVALRKAADAAAAATAASPRHSLFSRLRYLFGIKSLEGVVPRVNEVYLFMNEMDNVLKVMRQMLRLPPGASTNKLLAGLQDAVEASRVRLERA